MAAPDGVFGTVCDDHFIEEDAVVVCQAVNLTSTDASVCSLAPSQWGRGDIVLDEVDCSLSSSNFPVGCGTVPLRFEILSVEPSWQVCSRRSTSILCSL